MKEEPHSSLTLWKLKKDHGIYTMTNNIISKKLENLVEMDKF